MRLFPLLLLFLLPGLAQGWIPNGARLTGALNDQVVPMIASDGSGGAFVAWHDQRDYFTGDGTLGTDCYLQHVTAAGVVAPGWPQDGLAIGTGQGHQFPWTLIPDGSGGVLIAMGDTRLDGGDLYLQRITFSGTIAQGWPAGGLALGAGLGKQWLPQLASDGAGGAFASWQVEDEPAPTAAAYTRVLGSGQIAPGWPLNGTPFQPGATIVNRPLLLPNEGGGFLACWSVALDPDYASIQLLAQRFEQDGSEDPAWPEGGVLLSARRAFPSGHLVSNSAGGFYVVIEDYSNSPTNRPFDINEIYVQHVNAAGEIAAGWSLGGLQAGSVSNAGQFPGSCEDGAGGLFVSWFDYRSGFARVFMQHFKANGQRHSGWPEMGLSFTATPGFQLDPQLAWDLGSGAYVTWMNLESGGYRSYAKHLTANGATSPGWPPDGLRVAPIESGQYGPQLVTDAEGAVVITWEDTRNSETDIYAQRFVADGVVSTQVSIASTDASPNEVRVRWHVSGESQASVERRVGEGSWRAVAYLNADGSGYMSYVDRDVRAGSTYSYRLAFASQARGGETSVQVPAAFVLALEGVRPNPASGPISIEFTLPDANPARVELFDLSGRRVASEFASGLGRHLVRLDRDELAPGLYWATLVHGGHTLKTRVVLTR